MNDQQKRLAISVGALLGAFSLGYFVGKRFGNSKKAKKAITLQKLKWEEAHQLDQDKYKHKIAQIWNAYDKDGNGYLDPTELHGLIEDLYARLAEENTSGFLHDLFQEEPSAVSIRDAVRTAFSDRESVTSPEELVARFDTDKDGKISRAEFLAGFGMFLCEKIKAVSLDI
eukprot:TRINITY_DN364_c0_g2_i1.p1 TRINITY_DN364_c0_g2~~TRINITY_DN364_c0_g2_i1.p1  ORF type:complete len:190 (-),score=88.28 TRINITY_DN364_c0_g2_i1:124-636(-)